MSADAVQPSDDDRSGERQTHAAKKLRALARGGSALRGSSIRVLWLARLSALAGGWVILTLLALGLPGDMRDAGAYYGARLDAIYAHHTFLDAGYLYSPAFAILVEPFRWFPAQVLETTIRMASAVALGYLVTPFVGAAMILVGWPGLRAELGVGNIDLVVAAVLVWVLWRPWLWPALLLTKVTPGVGLAWHVARREWHAIGIAAGSTLLMVLMTLPVVGFEAWTDWASVLTGENVAIADSSTAIPVLPRLLVGTLLGGMAGPVG